MWIRFSADGDLQIPQVFSANKTYSVVLKKLSHAEQSEQRILRDEDYIQIQRKSQYRLTPLEVKR